MEEENISKDMVWFLLIPIIAPIYLICEYFGNGE